jgi:hypothetical protein
MSELFLVRCARIGALGFGRLRLRRATRLIASKNRSQRHLSRLRQEWTTHVVPPFQFFDHTGIRGPNGSVTKRDLPGFNLGNPIGYRHYFS